MLNARKHLHLSKDVAYRRYRFRNHKQSSTVHNFSSTTTKVAEKKEDFLSASKVFLKDQDTSSLAKETSSYDVILSKSHEQQLGEGESKYELKQRSEYEWTDEAVQSGKSKVEATSSETRHFFDIEKLEDRHFESLENDRARIRELKKKSNLMRAKVLALDELRFQQQEKQRKQEKKDFVYGLAKVVLNSPIGRRILSFSGWDRVDMRSPPSRINITSLRDQMRNPPTEYETRLQRMALMHEYKKIYGFPMEKREPPYPPDEEGKDPSIVDDTDQMEQPYLPERFKSRPRSIQTEPLNRDMEEWEKEEKFRNFLEREEYYERIEKKKNRAEVVKKRRVFEEAWAPLLKGTPPPEKQKKAAKEAEETEEASEEVVAEGEEAQSEEGLSEEEKERARQLQAELDAEKAQDEPEMSAEEAEEFRKAQEERERRNAEKDAQKAADKAEEEDEGISEEEKRIRNAQQEQKAAEKARVEADIRNLLSRQSVLEEERDKKAKPTLDKGLAVITESPTTVAEKIKYSVKGALGRVETNLTSWAKAKQLQLYPKVPETDEQRKARVEEESYQREMQRKNNLMWGRDITVNPPTPLERLANTRMREFHAHRPAERLYQHMTLLAYFQRIYGHAMTMRQFFKKLIHEIVPAFVSAHLNDDDDALRILATPKVANQLAEFRTPGLRGASRLISVARVQFLKKFQWIWMENLDIEKEAQFEQDRWRHLNDDRSLQTGMAQKFVGHNPSLNLPYLTESDVFDKNWRAKKPRDRENTDIIGNNLEMTENEFALKRSIKDVVEKAYDVEQKRKDEIRAEMYKKKGVVGDWYKPEVIEQEAKENKKFWYDVDPAQEEFELLENEIWTEEKDWTDEEIVKYWQNRDFTQALSRPEGYIDMRRNKHLVPKIKIKVQCKEGRRVEGIIDGKRHYAGKEISVTGHYTLTLRGPAGIQFGPTGWRVVEFSKHATRRDWIP